MSLTNTTEVASVHDSLMIPGQWEPGSPTRFAARPEVPQPLVDVTIGVATIADRKREGGGLRQRHPARVLPLTALVRRIGAMWRARGTPPQPGSVPEAVAAAPRSFINV